MNNPMQFMNMLKGIKNPKEAVINMIKTNKYVAVLTKKAAITNNTKYVIYILLILEVTTKAFFSFFFWNVAINVIYDNIIKTNAIIFSFNIKIIIGTKNKAIIFILNIFFIYRFIHTAYLSL